MKVPFITTSAGLNVIVNGQNKVVANDHKYYVQILEGLRAGNSGVVNLLDELKRQVADFDGVDFQLSHGELLFRGKPYENKFVTEHVFKMLDNGIKAPPLIRFLEKVEANPLPESVQDLWAFMENHGLAISDSGDVLAFKYVTKVSEMPDSDKKKALVEIGAEYTDSYTQKFDYTPGKIPEMPRHQCEYNQSKDCGVGLHIGSFSYVKGNQHILAVSFSPADVISIGKNEGRKIRVARFNALHIVQEEHIGDNGYKFPVFGVKDGRMSMSEFTKNSIKTNSVLGELDNESAPHWSSK